MRSQQRRHTESRLTAPLSSVLYSFCVFLCDILFVCNQSVDDVIIITNN